jgi:hypothetical protein
MTSKNEAISAAILQYLLKKVEAEKVINDKLGDGALDEIVDAIYQTYVLTDKKAANE